jgi:hypothetical protein
MPSIPLPFLAGVAALALAAGGVPAGAVAAQPVPGQPVPGQPVPGQPVQGQPILGPPAPSPPAAVLPAAPGTPPASAARALAGGVLGGAAGVLLGGLAGAYVGGNRCTDPGNPDTCALIGGVLGGVYVGYTLGTPVGAHLLDRRRGDLRRSTLASTAILVAGVGLLRVAGVSLNGTSTPGQRRLALTVALAVPVLQLASATVIETRTGRRR